MLLSRRWWLLGLAGCVGPKSTSTDTGSPAGPADTGSSGTWVGDVTDSDVKGFCDGYPERFIVGNLTLQFSQRTDLLDLSCVVSVSGYVEIRQCDQLTSLSGLQGLASVGELSIDDNDVLTDVTALYPLTEVGGDVTITDNLALGDEAAQALVDSIGSIGGSVTISGN